MRHDHRWMMTPGRLRPPEIIYQLLESDLSNQKSIWMAGLGSIPVRIPSTAVSGGATPPEIGDQRLRPQGDKLFWHWGSGSTERLYTADAPAGTSLLKILETTTRNISPLYWHPNGIKIQYVLSLETSPFDDDQLREINWDGTGDTLVLQNPTTERFSNFGGPYNRTGEHIGWFQRFKYSASYRDYGYYTLNISSGTITPTKLFVGAQDSGLIAWSNIDDDIFYFVEKDFNSTPYHYRIRKINRDGTGDTVLADYLTGPTGFPISTNQFVPSAQYSVSSPNPIAPDDTFMVGYLDTDPGNTGASCYIARLWLDGSGNVENLAPSYPIGKSSLAQPGHRPFLWGQRVYWHDAVNNRVVSILRNGSDFTIDHDLGITKTFFGFTGPGTV